MKKWAVSLAISIVVSLFGLYYFLFVVVKNNCLNAGGIWNGIIKGCDGSSAYSIDVLSSPLSIAIYLGIILGISGALVQIQTIISGFVKGRKAS